jgi:hypothetical protein
MLFLHAVEGTESIPQGLKPSVLERFEKPKAKALGYLEAKLICPRYLKQKLAQP